MMPNVLSQGEENCNILPGQELVLKEIAAQKQVSLGQNPVIFEQDNNVTAHLGQESVLSGPQWSKIQSSSESVLAGSKSLSRATRQRQDDDVREDGVEEAKDKDDILNLNHSQIWRKNPSHRRLPPIRNYGEIFLHLFT